MSTIKRPGIFLTFEGPDGSGKSTQAKLLAERLRAEGRDVIETVEPGGTRIGNEIRRILLDPANHDLSSTAELLLMFAARAQNVDEMIVPALDAGKIVVCDRFTDSSIAYQGSGRGLGWDVVRELDRIACRGLALDLTICIDIDSATGLARAQQRGGSDTRLEEQAIEFHHKVRDAYHELARLEPARFRLIDGRGAREAVATEVWREIAPLFK